MIILEHGTRKLGKYPSDWRKLKLTANECNYYRLNAPIENDNELNVKYSIDYFLKLGAPAHKLIMGLPFYGRTFITNKEGNLGDETDDQGFQGPFTRENGFMGYNEV